MALKHIAYTEVNTLKCFHQEWKVKKKKTLMFLPLYFSNHLLGFFCSPPIFLKKGYIMLERNMIQSTVIYLKI